MRKYLLMLLGLTISCTSAHAMTADEQMNAMKGMYIKEFNKIDKNKDGKISKEEYISYQFDSFRSNILSSSGFTLDEEDIAATDEIVPEKSTAQDKNEAKTKDIAIDDVPEALKAMAEYDIDMDDNQLSTSKDGIFGNPVRAKIDLDDLTAELEEDTDALETESKENLSDLDLSVSEEDNFKELLNKVDTNAAQGEDADLSSADKDAQIAKMMETIKQTLPKKIDSITTWTDITYKDSTISYIYQADMDTSKFTDEEKKALETSIKQEACNKAYTDMCPKVKPMFIDEGINVEIRYFDRKNAELSSCEFNKKTCSN